MKFAIICLILVQQVFVYARFNYNAHLINWFGNITNGLCTGFTRQMMGLDPHQCASTINCENIEGTKIIRGPSSFFEMYFCFERFQNLGFVLIFPIGKFIVKEGSLETLSIDFNIEGQISYYISISPGLLDANLCILGFTWINSQNDTIPECMICNYFNYGKNCLFIADGVEADMTSKNLDQKHTQCQNANCKTCKSGGPNQCVSYQCVNFQFGETCSETCQLNCTKDTCICDPQTGSYLSCKEGFVEENNDLGIICVQKCDYNCKQCELSIEGKYICKSCKYQQTYQQLQFMELTIVNGKCEGIQNCLEYIINSDSDGLEYLTCFHCFPGFYLNQNQNQCLSCEQKVTACLFCSKKEPIICAACKRGYYLDERKNCQPAVKYCGSSCSLCLASNANYCTVCNQQYFIDQFGKCFCIDGYYETGKSSPRCIKCHQSCFSCINGGLSDCTSCKYPNTQFLNGQCYCIQGFGRKNSLSYECDFCHSRCKTCEFSNNPLSCTQCNKEQNRLLTENLECVCKQNFNDQLGKLDVCYQCHYTCSSCNGSSAYNCLSCSSQSNRSLTKDKQCKCNQYYVESEVQQNQCQRCNYSCHNCINNSNEDSCIECPNSRIPDSNNQKFKCICRENYFDDGISQECYQCHYSCLTCKGINSYNCLSCDSTYRILNNQSCDCLAHSLDGGSVICYQCHYSCFTCLDNHSQSCYDCSLDEDFRFLSEGLCYCIEGYFDDGQQTVCQQCSYKCKTCKDAKDTCIECANNSLRILGSNFDCSCPSHYVPIENEPTCFKCHFKCADCDGGNENNCTKCDGLNNRELQDSQCLCKKHYFEIDVENCQICSQYCQECENVYDNCTSCRPDRIFVGNKCQCGTKLNGLTVSTIDYNGEPNCLACHYSCLTCDGLSLNICLTCLASENRFYFNKKCICEDGYVDIGLPKCQKCSYNCENCYLQQIFCTSCKPDTFRILNISKKSCQCQQGYFDDGSSSACQKCDYTCEYCSQQATNCLSCPLNSNRTYNSILLKCDCSNSYYNNGQVTCNKCHYSCKNCNGNNETNCTQCSPSVSTFRYLDNNRCACLESYYDNGIEICGQCAIQCLTCSDYSFQCLSCVYTRQLQQTDCICKIGYFENSKKDCSKCDDNCLGCKFSSKNCTSCNIFQFRVLITQTSRCECLDGYLEIDQICQKCSSSCQTCINVQEQCQTCPFNRFKNGYNCLCNFGYFDDGNDCQQCHKSCETCFQSYDFCLTCSKQDQRKLKINQCICQDGYFENILYNSCQKCSKNCFTCVSTPTFCLTCHQFEMIDQITNKCTCSKGYYIEGAVEKCLECHYSCLICETYSKCLECSNQTRYLNNNYECNCQLGYYEVNLPSCNKCQYFCSTCATESFNCLSCNSVHKRELNKNYCKCLNGYYDVGIEICQACSNTCKSCILSSTQCLSCFDQQFRTLKGNNCICKDGYFDNGNQICKECSKSCHTCIQSATRCTSCDTNQKRFDQSKIFKCPCIQGYFENMNQVCQKCNIKCEACMNTNDSCLSCSRVIHSNRQSISQNCICKNGYYDDGINVICQTCDSKCKLCQDQSTYCVECSNSLRGNPPGCQCIEGYYEIENYCLQCENQCQSCIQNQFNCLTCKIGRVGKACKCQDGFYEAGLESCQPCENQCQTCQLADYCLICKGDRVKLPYCYCQEGYYEDNLNEYCQACDTTCKSCIISGCITCNGNRILSSEMSCDPPIGSISYATTYWCSDCQVAVVQVNFSDDLSQILIKFDFPLKQFPNNYFNKSLCDSIIGQNTLTKLGQNYDCQISESDQSIFIISLDYTAEIEIGENVELNKNILSHLDCERKLEIFIFSFVKLSQNSLPPIIQFNVPNYDLSPCLETLILFNLTENDGKRQFTNLNWSYIIQPDQRNIKLDEVIEEQNKFQLLNLLIPAETLPEVKTIFFFLNVTNFANITSNISFYINTKTISEPIIQLQSKGKFYAYEKIELQFLFSSFSNCQLPQNDQVHFNITFSERKRSNPQAKHFNLPQSVQVNSNQYLLSIVEYTLSPKTTYDFKIFLIDKNTNQNATTQFQIEIEEAELFCQFSYFPNIQDVRQDLNLNLLCKDLNENQDWNSDPEINVVFQCNDLTKSDECRDKRNKTIKMIPNSFYQSVKKFSLEPYSIQQWQATATKNNKFKSISVTILFLQASTQAQKLIFNQWLQMRLLGNYELLNFTFDIPASLKANLSSLSIGFVYDFELVKILSPIFSENQFRIYDSFGNFRKNRKLNIYFQSQYTHSITPSQTSLTFQVGEPPSCGKLYFKSKSLNEQIYLKIGVSCLISKFPPLKYKFNYFFSENDLDEYINNLADFSLGFQEYQLSNSFQTYIPNSFQNQPIYLLIQVIDSSGSKTNIFDKHNFEDLPVSCDINKLISQEMNLKVSLMFSALSNVTNQSCLEFAKLIYHNLTVQSLQQQNYILLQAIKVYRKLFKIVSIQQEQLNRELEEKQFSGCLDIKTSFFYSEKLNQQQPPLEKEKLKEFATNINLIKKLLDTLISQKQVLEESLNRDLNVWNEETMDKFKTKISQFLSTFHLIDEYLTNFVTNTQEDDELYQIVKSCQQILLDVISYVEKNILVDEKIFQLGGDFINLKLQKQTPFNFLNQWQMKVKDENSLIKYFIKRQIDFKFNPLIFSKSENENIKLIVNSSVLMLDYSNYIIQNLFMSTEFGSYLKLKEIQQIQTQIRQFQVCSDSIEDQQLNYSINCIQLLENGKYQKCETLFIKNEQNSNLVDVNCRCDKMGDLFLGYSQNNNLTQQKSETDSTTSQNFFQIDITNKQLLIQLIFLNFALVISLILHQRDQHYVQNFQIVSETVDSPQRNKKIYRIHPSNFVIFRQNYQYLHNFLCLFYYQPDLTTRSFNFMGLALQVQLTYMLSIQLIKELSDHFFVLRIVILILVSLFYRAVLKVCKGIFRLNKILRFLQTSILFSLMVAISIITIYLAKNLNHEIDAIIYTVSTFLGFELIFEPILIFARIYVYLIAIPQIRDLLFNKVLLMMYYFSWHWKLEQTLKQCVAV